jgi:hypothetical protein
VQWERGGDRYDVIFDAVGKRKSGAAMVNSAAVLAPGGVQMSVDDGFPRMLTSDLLRLKRLAEDGELRPVIDRRYALDEIVEAHRYVDLGHKKGNVIVTVAREDPPRGPDRCRRFVLGEFLAGPEGIATDGIDWQGSAGPRDRSGSWPELERAAPRCLCSSRSCRQVSGGTPVRHQPNHRRCPSRCQLSARAALAPSCPESTFH